jgi:transposase-like protein
MASELVCPRCQSSHCTRNGSSRGHWRFACRECGRTFGVTVGTPLFRLHTPLSEIVRAILIVLRRGSLRAAEEQTGHNYETIAAWIRRIGGHAEAITQVLVRDLELSAVELDEFWSFVGEKGERAGRRARLILPRPTGGASTGAA